MGIGVLQIQPTHDLLSARTSSPEVKICPLDSRAAKRKQWERRESHRRTSDEIRWRPLKVANGAGLSLDHRTIP